MPSRLRVPRLDAELLATAWGAVSLGRAGADKARPPRAAPAGFLCGRVTERPREPAAQRAPAPESSKLIIAAPSIGSIWQEPPDDCCANYASAPRFAACGFERTRCWPTPRRLGVRGYLRATRGFRATLLQMWGSSLLQGLPPTPGRSVVTPRLAPLPRVSPQNSKPGPGDATAPPPGSAEGDTGRSPLSHLRP